MIQGERTRREIGYDGKNIIGTQVYLCDWNDIDPAPVSGLPQYGEPWISYAGFETPFLRCINAKGIQLSTDPTLGEYTATFSTERQLSESYVDWSLEISLEPGPDPSGYIWAATGTPVVNAIAKSIPVGILTIRVRKSSVPTWEMFCAAGKVNSLPILGMFPAGCVLFLGTALENNSDTNGNIISASTVYRFSVKQREHKYFWRPPLQARSSLESGGILLTWQNDPNVPFYTTDHAKVGTQVWINEVPGLEDDPAGIGGWDQWLVNGDPYYEECDFATVLGLSI